MSSTIGAAERDRVRTVSWAILAGAAAGALAGLLVGGVGGRLAMLLLRVTSPDSVDGLTTDDGFEIGVISTSTFNLLGAMAMAGGIVGVIYAVLRPVLSARFRVALWTLVWALIGGAAVVNDDGVDFSVLEPTSLAIALFVVLPGLGALVLALLAERWSRAEPFHDRRLTIGLAVAALAGTFAVAFALVVGGVLLAVHWGLAQLGSARAPLARAATIFVPVVLAVLAGMAALDLIRDSARLL